MLGRQKKTTGLHEGGEARSKAAKGNDNAAKAPKNGACTDCTPTVSGKSQEPRPTRKTEAKAAGVNAGAMNVGTSAVPTENRTPLPKPNSVAPSDRTCVYRLYTLVAATTAPRS